MKRLHLCHDPQQHCEFSQQDKRGHWQCGLLQFSGQPVAIVSSRGKLEWATSSAHEILSRYWPDHQPLGTFLPQQIRQWMNKTQKKSGARKNAARCSAPLVIE